MKKEIWIKNENKKVQEYLKSNKVDHLGVVDYPAFEVYPYLALWAIQSKEYPGKIGWWAISGDCPTDYISNTNLNHPRKALKKFSELWDEIATYMLRGEKHPEYSIGTPDQWPNLGDLLKKRASILADYANNDELWEED